MKTSLTIAATAAAAVAATLSASALADTSTPSEFRGYQACLEANEADFSGLVPERNYLVAKTDAGRTYYINATAWKAGQRVEVGFSCQTTRSGRLLENQSTGNTRYVPANPAGIQVAGK